MKYIITTIVLIGLTLSSHMVLAQSTPVASNDIPSSSQFDKLYNDLKEQYSGKDFKTALSTLEKIKALINSQFQAAQKLDQPDSEAFALLYDKAKYPATLKFGDHTLKVYGNKDIFVSGDDPKSADSSLEYRDIFIGTFSVSYDGNNLINDVYCKINNRTEEIHYQSSGAKVITVSNHEDLDAISSGQITIHGVGNAIVTLILAGQSLELPIKVTKIPVYNLMLTDDLIKLLGLPDKQTSDVVEWPNYKYIDGIRYEPTASQGKLYTDHWFYNKYPRVVFAVDGTQVVKQIHDMGW